MSGITDTVSVDGTTELLAELEGPSRLSNSSRDARLTRPLDAGHDDRAWHIAWNPTRPILASCSADKTVRLYNYNYAPSTSDGAVAFSLNTTIPTGHAKTVRAVAWSPSGQSLATASFDANIGVWGQEEDEDGDEGGGGRGGEWECMSLLEGHETECKSVAYSSSGTLLASCSRDKTVWIWEGVYQASYIIDPKHPLITRSAPGRGLRVHGRAHGAHAGRQVRRLAPHRRGPCPLSFPCFSSRHRHRYRSLTPHSTDPRLRVLRRHHQALPRRPVRRLVLRGDARGARVDRVGARVGAARRAVPRVRLRRHDRSAVAPRARARGVEVRVRGGYWGA